MWLSPCLGEGGEFEIHQRRTQHSTSTRLRQLWLDAYFFSFFCCQGGGLSSDRNDALYKPPGQKTSIPTRQTPAVRTLHDAWVDPRRRPRNAPGGEGRTVTGHCGQEEGGQDTTRRPDILRRRSFAAFATRLLLARPPGASAQGIRSPWWEVLLSVWGRVKPWRPAEEEILRWW